jgi:glycosyltransferase involved in cell wall biosynthesis
MAGGPLVSVIVPVYNAGPYLREAVQSVLAQTHRDWEMWLVDDGSTDGCVGAAADLLNDPRIHVLRQPNSGKPTALNAALRRINGDFYAILDADDVAHPARLERQVAALLSEPDVGTCFVGHELLIGGRRLAPRMRAKGRSECKADIDAMRMPGHDPTAMYRRALVKDILYEPSLPVVEGYDHILRVGECHPMVVIGECLYSYRVHPNSVTRQNVERRRSLVREVRRRACERRGTDPREWVSPDLPLRRVTNRDRDNNLVAHLMESVLDLRSARRYGEALRVSIRSASLHPLDPAYFKPGVYAVAPMRWIEAWRARRGSGAAAL